MQPSSATTVPQRIAQALPQLTRSHRQVADYVLERPLQVATLPIDELAAMAGVSVATANRFARALGFDGYASFRAELVRGFEPLVAPVERLRGNLANPSSVAEVFSMALEESQRNIEATRHALDPASCEAAVERVLGARTVFVAGFGASAWLAGLLHHGLDAYCADVRLLPSMSGVTHGARSLARGGSRDLLVALTFPRYLTDTLALTGIARKQGIGVLALTDRPSSPLAPLADITLYAQTETRFRPNCETSVLALVEALTSAVALRAPGAFQAASKVVQTVMPWLHGAQDLRATPASARIKKRLARQRPAGKKKTR
ncbi:MurR/RpiR family transcriptional regulator [Variovorax sp. JS1663]|uniref:MurR/RpiR family transcriptional regulator n=1 Tax=Variovorax sp. JS1663 TaxID=1851577 RepID=UPI000B3425BB|nr:MurR/RpiR family transcriptional regulator [Variovorax sp. JS1663]OUM02276.1 transcriptional regulator [Variovorax sp. JS1663]